MTSLEAGEDDKQTSLLAGIFAPGRTRWVFVGMLLMSVVLLLAFVLQPQATALASWGLSYAGDGQQGNLEVSELGVKSESERDLDGQDSQEEGKAGSNVHKRLLVRTEGTNTAGLGSILAQSRRSAVFAELVQARLIIPGIQSDHGYTPADLINRAINSSWELPSNPTVCRATMLLPAGEIEKILEAWCDSRDDELGKTLLRVYESCHVILDDRPWEVSYAFSRCTWRWTRKVLLGSESEGVKTTKGSVGLHLRWGDMQESILSQQPTRIISMLLAKRLLSRLEECNMMASLTVYMESANMTMLSGLEREFRLVDSGNDLQDLMDLASNEIMILGFSGYTDLAHQISDGKMTVVPDNYKEEDPFLPYYQNSGTNKVLKWTQTANATCDEIAQLLSTKTSP